MGQLVTMGVYFGALEEVTVLWIRCVPNINLLILIMLSKTTSQTIFYISIHRICAWSLSLIIPSRYSSFCLIFIV